MVKGELAWQPFGALDGRLARFPVVEDDDRLRSVALTEQRLQIGRVRLRRLDQERRGGVDLTGGREGL